METWRVFNKFSNMDDSFALLQLHYIEMMKCGMIEPGESRWLMPFRIETLISEKLHRARILDHCDRQSWRLWKGRMLCAKHSALLPLCQRNLRIQHVVTNRVICFLYQRTKLVESDYTSSIYLLISLWFFDYIIKYCILSSLRNNIV